MPTTAPTAAVAWIRTVNDMRCECYECRENEGGYCLCSSYVTITVNGECDSMYIPIPGKDGE